MKDTAAFDAFYVDARARLLHQTYALTGDLGGAQAAVQDAFVAAWHHWRRVSSLEDPEVWVRRRAWGRASRKQSTRLWSRSRSTDPDEQATQEALAKLSSTQRKVLLLSQLTPGPLAAVAREVELPLATVERELQSGTAQFASHRNVDSALVRATLDRLAVPAAAVRWPRATIIRRAGNTRRRTHTLVSAAAVTGLLVASGAAVTAGADAHPRLTQEQAIAPTPVATTPEAPVPELSPAQLLTAAQVSRVSPDRRWRVARTAVDPVDKSEAASLACAAPTVAGPRTIGTLVRTYRSESAPGHRRDKASKGSGSSQASQPAAASQTTELSTSTRAATKAYANTRDWYAGCPTDRVQLVSTHRVAKVGDDATMVVLKSWADPAHLMVVGVARTGSVTTSVVSRLPEQQKPDLKPEAALLAAAVNTLCGAPGTGTCSGPPELAETAPLPTGPVPGMLSEVDLPPVSHLDEAWVGTQPRKAVVNAAATQCDAADFMRPGMSNAMTRTFVAPEANLPDSFGLTQTVATSARPAAKAFVEQIRSKLAACEDKHIGTKVTKVADEGTADSDLSVWRVDVEVSDKVTVTYLMGVSRAGTAVTQVGFTPTDGYSVSPDDFVAVVRRAQERLAYLPEPRGKG